MSDLALVAIALTLGTLRWASAHQAAPSLANRTHHREQDRREALVRAIPEGLMAQSAPRFGRVVTTERQETRMVNGKATTVTLRERSEPLRRGGGGRLRFARPAALAPALGPGDRLVVPEAWAPDRPGGLGLSPGRSGRCAAADRR